MLVIYVHVLATSLLLHCSARTHHALLALQVVDQATALGFHMRILDIGGGFAGGCFDATGQVQLGLVPTAVNTALATYFPDPSFKVGPHSCSH